MPDDIKLPEPAAWLVCSVNKDGSLYLVQAVAWKEAAHEHINDAINEYDIKGAANWVVRAAYTADQVHAAIAAVEADRAQQAAEIERLRTDAERYRWLRSLEWFAEAEIGIELDGSAWRVTFSSPAPFENASGGSWLDAAIDAAHGIPAPKGGSDA